jgi:glycosyltransferase involved in cell wall biosynthesis
MNLVLLISNLGAGGAERAVSTLSRELASRGHRVTVVTYSDEPDAFVLGAAVRRLHVGAAGHAVRWFDVRGQIRRTAALRSALRAIEPDAVVSFLDGTNELFLLSALGVPCRKLVSCQVDLREHPHANWRWSRLRDVVYRFADRVVVLDAEQADWCRTHYRGWRVEAIPNPVEIPPPGEDGTPVVPDWTCRRTLVAMGRLVRQKGFDLLLEAFARCADAHPDWGVLILGEGPERDALGEQAAALALGDRVRLAGRVLPPFATLRSADLFVLSSRYEGQGLALIEAMGCGLPAVSFDCRSGPRQIIRDGIDGVLVAPEDVVQLAHALSRLMGDAARRGAMGEAALRVVERFSPRRCGDLWESLLTAGPDRRAV